MDNCSEHGLKLNDFLKSEISKVACEQLEIARDNMITNKKWFDDKTNIRINPFIPGDLVLLFDSTFEIISIGRKFKKRYKGPYIVIAAYPNGSYKIAELDGSIMKKSIHGNRLVPFNPRENSGEFQFRGGKTVTSYEVPKPINPCHMAIKRRAWH
ncbi:hypothetical protein O9G_006303 [Rozella allomycis CSF55]|uniref:Uncharacterized protein n=1 Tax=Rozella allomycis (strain CSF55) TaxID=988480 RepID=A0A075B4M9_ROZAC|nr:hypothetical protein O9G_006303 [Rozella allomycis CSF55]|eukprot:EPZ36312.1 hypothetical protein O9G_006303 [Rozella allomycis CSF55]